MSDLLVHWAVFDDCRRLALQDKRVEPLLAQIAHEEREFARLGALTRGGGRYVPEILGYARANWAAKSQDQTLRRKVAFALGGITHYAADQVLKPLMKQYAKADWNDAHHAMQGRGNRAGVSEEAIASVREISAYYDTHVFRKVYLTGQEEPFTRFLTAANATAPGQALEEFVRSLFQRALLSAHTFDPDLTDVQQWLDRLFAQVQPLYIDIALYARVFAQPDPAKMQTFAVETAFYRDDDPVVRVSRALHQGQTISQAELDAAIHEGANRGGYGRSVELGARRLREASAYWRGETDQTPDLRQGKD